MRFIKKLIYRKLSLIAEKKIRSNHFLPINEINENDIFISGFPKSGNTWMQHLVSGILLESTSHRITPRLVNEIVPDVHAKKYYKRFFSEMFFKTHHLPQPQYQKVIHLVRDGRDAMVSYYNYRKMLNNKTTYSLHDMIYDGLGVFPVKWVTHTKSWLNNPYDAHILTVRYEDLLAQPVVELKRICAFAKIEVTDVFLERLVSNNSLTSLRKKTAAFGTDFDHVYKQNKSSNFFRKGLSGSYINEMPQELITFFTSEAAAELQFFGYNT